MKVAVTGLNNVDSPGPGVPVIRGIKDSGRFEGEIIGLIYDSLEPGAYMNEISNRNYVIPYPSGGLDSLLDRISFINEKEKIDVLIPTLDSELYGFVKLAPKLKAMGIKTFLPTIENLNLRAKDKLFKFCDDNDINVPKNILVSSIQDLYKIPSVLTYPVVVKGIFYDAYVVHNFDEAVSAFHKIANSWGLPVIIQQYVQGEEYNVCALGDGTGSVIGAVSMKKLYITKQGKGWAGVTIDDKVLKDLTEKIISTLKWKSGTELEFIKDKKTNEYYMIEINPRFPAWCYLSVAAGQNLPYSLLQLANNEKVDKFDKYIVGKIFIRYSWDLITDVKKFEEISVKGENDNG